MLFTPTSILVTKAAPPTSPPSTNLWGWWDAQHSYTETSGTPTTLITVDGTSVGSQIDRSGGGHHIYQATAANKPVFHTNVLNSLASCTYNPSAVATWLLSNSTYPPGSTFTVYVVANRTTFTNLAMIVGGNFAAPFFALFDHTADPTLACYTGGYGAQVSMSDAAWHLEAASFDSSGASSVTVLRQDAGTDNNGSIALATNSDTSVAIGAYQNGPVGWTGSIIECLIYTSIHAFSSGDGLLARQYLNAKYNLGLGI